ncbi:MAG: hypothetical protein AAF564_08205 [Bacteroidota bacterium]
MSNTDTIAEPTSQTNGAAPENYWTETRDQLKRVVADVHNTTVDGAEKLEKSISDDHLSPILEAFGKAAAVHNTLQQEIKTALEQGEGVTWEQVLKYRRGAMEQVLKPLNARLGVQVSEQVYKSFLKLFTDLRSSIANMPATQQIPEPPNLFAPSPSDAAWTRLRKMQVRSGKHMRAARYGIGNGFRKLVGRPAINTPIPQQEVKLQELLRYHVKVRVPNVFTETFNAIHGFLTKHIAAFERAQTQWTYLMLDLELEVAEPDHQLDALDAWLSLEKAAQRYNDPNWAKSLLNAITGLHSCIEEIAALEVPTLQVDTGLLETCAQNLYVDFKHSGTFLLRDRAIPESSDQVVSQLGHATGFWKTWYREASNRLNLNTKLHELRDFLLRRQKGLLGSIAKASVIPILKSFDQLRDTFLRVQEEVIQICSGPAGEQDEAKIRAELEVRHQQITGQFKRILNDVTNLLRAGQALEEPGTVFWNDLHRFIEGLPEQVEVHETSQYPISEQESIHHQYQIELREIVQSALLKSFPEQLTKCAKALQKAVIHTWEETQQVEYMVDYNIKAAFAEMLDEQEKQDITDATQPALTAEPDDPVALAQELITAGLGRSTEKLTELAKGLHGPWINLADKASAAIKVYSVDILHNVLEEDHMNNRWTNFKMKVTRSFKKMIQSGENQLSRFQQTLADVVKRGRRRTRQLIKKGQTAVGVVDQSEDQWLSTLDLASDIDTLHKRLPLVYRRLFSLKPLADLDLLEGRKLDVAFVKKHYAQWQKSQTGPLLLSMPDGSGRTSFMNVLIRSIFEGANVQPISLSRRVPDDTAFAHQVAEALGIPVSEDLTLASLEAHIIATPRKQEPLVLVIDRFEHLLLCSPGGHSLIERVLIFMSRTDNLIYWVINVSAHAWHFLEKTMSPSSGFISAYRVTNLQRQALEDIILKRHHRSGMNLQFRPTIASKTWLDFASRGSEQSQQDAHRAAFFDKLYRLSGQNILLALLYWLRAVEFDAEEDTLFVNGIQPINFSFLETLDLPRAFTLKSFLTHGTLTLTEHMRVFKLSETDSTFILESLLNLRIIEPSGAGLEDGIHFRIEKDQPYRLHPLIVHPVLEFLTKKHIVY